MGFAGLPNRYVLPLAEPRLKTDHGRTDLFCARTYAVQCLAYYDCELAWNNCNLRRVLLF